ncbi:GntR family transcriptional regulator [Gulosibacter sp. ACHW.36C]|uniref:GntR family transcriptional regulator n=1 Tax=Gulosibacter sediminis TaxID=1729695 RepID=A0ABY4MWH8_9MICO|nr:GntR family transcriptional regulator [Gulosibacter sediminis]UQN14487.1 GntR family transcriptional regulator [Gulosibacter sediminis]
MQSRTESLLVAIRDRIRTAQIAPGEVIAENQFTEEFGVSRTPVRETFRLLTTEGWLQVLPRKGYLVRPLNLTDIREVMDMRIILEPELAARAAIAPAREAIAEIEEIIANQHQSGIGLAQQVEFAAEFHVKVAMLSGNHRAASTLRPLVDEINRLHFVLPGLGAHISSTTEREAHESILAAIARNDGEAARALQLQHLEESQSAMLRAF